MLGAGNKKGRAADVVPPSRAFQKPGSCVAKSLATEGHALAGALSWESSPETQCPDLYLRALPSVLGLPPKLIYSIPEGSTTPSVF